MSFDSYSYISYFFLFSDAHHAPFHGSLIVSEQISVAFYEWPGFTSLFKIKLKADVEHFSFDCCCEFLGYHHFFQQSISFVVKSKRDNLPKVSVFIKIF